MKYALTFLLAILIVFGVFSRKSQPRNGGDPPEPAKSSTPAPTIPKTRDLVPSVSPTPLPAEVAMEQPEAKAVAEATETKDDVPQPTHLNDIEAVQAFLRQKTLAQPNQWNQLPLFTDRQKFQQYLRGHYKGPLIGLDKADLEKDLEINFDEISMNEEASLSGKLTLAIYNHRTERYERKAEPSGEGLTMIRHSGADSVTISWRGGRPSDELLQIFFPKYPGDQDKLFGILFQRPRDAQNQPLKPIASFVLSRRAP